MVYNPFYMLLGIFASILLSIFASTFIRDIGLNFLVMPLSGFGMREILASTNELRSVAYSSFLWMSFGKVDAHYSLNIWWTSPVKPLVLGFSLCEIF